MGAPRGAAKKAGLYQRCAKYKRAGNGYQAEALATENYLYSFYFRGDCTLPILDKGLSNLHNRVLLLLSDLKHDGHELYWDNLHPSYKLSSLLLDGVGVTLTDEAAEKTRDYSIPKVKTVGTCRGNRGFDGRDSLHPLLPTQTYQVQLILIIQA